MTEIQGQNGPLQADRDAAEKPAATAIAAIGVDLAHSNPAQINLAQSDQVQIVPVAKAQKAVATPEAQAASTSDAPVRHPSRSSTGRTGSTAPMQCAQP
jgi:hypothetical protein